MSEEEIKESQEIEEVLHTQEDLDDFLNLEALLDEATANAEFIEPEAQDSDINLEAMATAATEEAADSEVEGVGADQADAPPVEVVQRPSVFARVSGVYNRISEKVLARFAFVDRIINKVLNLKVVDKAYSYSIKTLNFSKSSYVKSKDYIKNTKPFIYQNKFALTVIGILIVCFLVTLKFIGDPFFDLRAKKPYITSLEQVADRIITIPISESFESYHSPLRQPEFFVSMDQVVVQLKSTKRAPRAFGRFEFYIETNNRRSLIEVSDRRLEILDLIQRTLETQTWDDLTTTRGKLKIKRLLRIRINSIMNYGRVREIYYKNLLLKKSRF